MRLQKIAGGLFKRARLRYAHTDEYPGMYCPICAQMAEPMVCFWCHEQIILPHNKSKLIFCSSVSVDFQPSPIYGSVPVHIHLHDRCAQKIHRHHVWELIQRFTVRKELSYGPLSHKIKI
jgi:hypothetical protein